MIGMSEPLNSQDHQKQTAETTVNRDHSTTHVHPVHIDRLGAGDELDIRAASWAKQLRARTQARQAVTGGDQKKLQIGMNVHLPL